MSHEHHFEKPQEAPKPTIPVIVGLVLAVIGFGIFGWKAFAGDAHDHLVAWNGYLIGFWFTMSLSLSGPFIISTQHLSAAGWSTSLRRVWEAYAAYIPVALLLGAFLVLMGSDTLYHWLEPGAMLDPALAKKAGMLNRPFLVGGTIGGLLVLWVVTFLMRRNSLKQDEESGDTRSYFAKALACLYLICFVIAYSIMSWLLLMSLQPHWFSTMWQVYAFAGLFQSGLALTVLIALYLSKKGTFGSAVGERQIHDLGQLMFGFTVFYMYIAFSQFLLIWYANIPEENIFFITRGASVTVTTGWEIPTLILPFFKFVLPFFILLPQEHKKNKFHILAIIAGLLLVMQVYEMWWIVCPVPHEHGTYAAPLHAPIFEILIAIGFIGLFVSVTSFAFSRHPVIPLKDPFIHETPFHHHHGVKAPEATELKIS